MSRRKRSAVQPQTIYSEIPLFIKNSLSTIFLMERLLGYLPGGIARKGGFCIGGNYLTWSTRFRVPLGISLPFLSFWISMPLTK